MNLVNKHPEKSNSNLAAYLLKHFDGDLKELHLITGIPYNKLTKGINDQLNLDLSDFYLIAIAVNPENINQMADEVFKNTDYLAQTSVQDYFNIEENEDNNRDNQAGNLSEFGNFLKLHLYSKQQLSKISGIGVNVINSLMKEDSNISSKLVAGRFYKLCKALERDFSYWTSKFYQHLRLTTKEERKILEDNFYKKNKTS